MAKKQDDMALTEKTLLSIAEFSAYVSLGDRSSRKLAAESGALVRKGKKKLYVDREKFDQWLDELEVNRKFDQWLDEQEVNRK